MGRQELPIASISADPGKDKDLFDIYVTGVKNPEQMSELWTRLRQIGYGRDRQDKSGPEAYLATVKCGPGEVLQEVHMPMIVEAIELAGMQVAA